MTTPLLKVAGLHAGYGRAEVLSGIDIEAAAGSVVAVVGPNGAGKSTLLNALMGVLPARGDVRFDGQAVQRLSLEQRVQRGIALVPETRALFATMPVADNLLLGGYRQRRAPRAEQAARLDEIYALFPRLHERQAQAAGTLSGGERQMLAIGRALMGRPRLLMLDEPSLGLAPLVVKEIFRIIERLRETGVTILLIEQFVHRALSLASQCVILKQGAVAWTGSAENAHQEVLDRYLGESADAMA